MSAAKMVTVYGATGQQGSSVINSLLRNSSKRFTVRAITRNPDSEKGKSLAARGVQVVKGDGFNKDDMLAAFRGSWAAFVNTYIADSHPGGLMESDLGKIIVDAAFEAGVQHLVYSGLISATEATNGHVPSAVFDEKHTIREHANSKGFKTVNIVSPGWYMENHIVPELAEIMGGFPFAKDVDGYLTLCMPLMGGSNELPFIAIADDYGDIVHGVLLQPEAYSGQLIPAASELATPQMLVETFQKLTGRMARYLPIEDWRAIETYGNPDLEAFKALFGLCQYVDGCYYGVPSDLGQARNLKAKAAMAMGSPEGAAELTSLCKFLRKHFGS